MPAAQTRRFVIRSIDRVGASTSLPSLGDLAQTVPLSGPTAGWVATVVGKSAERTVCRELQQHLGAAFQVIPVLDDGDGGERFPTGKISVRFSAPMSDTELSSFAKAGGLELMQRTKFTDRQALFFATPSEGLFLPDLVLRLAATQGVDRAWLDAESTYKRST